VPVDRLVRVLYAFADTLIAGVAQHGLLAAVQQRVRLRDVGHVAGRADHGMYEPCGHVHAHVRFHAEMPIIAFLRLVHLGITFLVAVLGRWRRRDQRGVNDRPLAHHQTFAGQVAVDLVEDPARQVVRLEPPTELEQRGRVQR
jgi:hypothetical protein